LLKIFNQLLHTAQTHSTQLHHKSGKLTLCVSEQESQLPQTDCT